MGPRKKSHARNTQPKASPAQPIRRGKLKASETIPLKPEQNDHGDQKPEYLFNDTQAQALALMSGAISPESPAGPPCPPYANSKPESHQQHQNKQRPENCVKSFFGVHTKCSCTAACLANPRNLRMVLLSAPGARLS
jgi:hypothetical protein